MLKISSIFVAFLDNMNFNSMNNLSSYCGLVDAKIRASDKDLPLQLPICVCGPCLWLIPSCQKSCGIWS